MEITGTVKRVKETETFGSNGFESRNLHLTTEEQYAQTLEIKFTQGRVSLLDGLVPGQKVKIAINLKGREHEKDGNTNVYNSIEGWKLEKVS